MLVITKVIPPMVALFLSMALIEFSGNKWEKTTSFGIMIYAFGWFIQSMKGVC